jgi:3-oxoacyl-[acyl-carrier protein] reductase
VGRTSYSKLAITRVRSVAAATGYPNVGGFGPAYCAIEGFSRSLASELGPFGVRVVNIRSGGSPDSRVFKEAIEQGGDRVTAFIQTVDVTCGTTAVLNDKIPQIAFLEH